MMTFSSTRSVPKECVLLSSKGVMEELGSTLKCGLCSDFIENNRECLKCNALFCNACLGQWMKEYKSCPNCKVAVASCEEGFVFNSVVHRLVNNLEVMCPNANKGCTNPVVKRSDYWCHVERECKGRTVQCPNCKFGCNFDGTALELETHLVDECLFEKELVKNYIANFSGDQSNYAKVNELLSADNLQLQRDIEAVTKRLEMTAQDLQNQKEQNVQLVKQKEALQQQIQQLKEQMLQQDKIIQQLQMQLQQIMVPPQIVQPLVQQIPPTTNTEFKEFLPPPPPYSPSPNMSYIQPPPMVVLPPRKFRFYGKTVWTKFQGKPTNTEVNGWEAVLEVDDSITVGDNVKGFTKHGNVEKKFSGFIRNGVMDVNVDWSDGRRAKYFANNVELISGAPIRLAFVIVAVGKQGGAVGDEGLNVGAIEQLM